MHAESAGADVDREEALIEAKRRRKRRWNRKRTPTYHTWNAMVQRVTNFAHKSFPDYGGRGVSIDPAWLGKGGYERFLADVGPRPTRRHTLDRIDPDGHYVRENVRWATEDVQAANKRWPVYTFGGITDTSEGWARRLDLEPGTVRKRRARGWSDAEVFTTPKGARRKKIENRQDGV